MASHSPSVISTVHVCARTRVQHEHKVRDLATFACAKAWFKRTNLCPTLVLDRDALGTPSSRGVDDAHSALELFVLGNPHPLFNEGRCKLDYLYLVSRSPPQSRHDLSYIHGKEEDHHIRVREVLWRITLSVSSVPLTTAVRRIFWEEIEDNGTLHSFKGLSPVPKTISSL